MDYQTHSFLLLLATLHWTAVVGFRLTPKAATASHRDELSQIRWNNLDANLCVDVKGGHLSDGTKVQMWGCRGENGGSKHEWILPPSGRGLIRWKSHPEKCLDVTPVHGQPVNHNGNSLQIWTCDQSRQGMQWIVPSSGTGRIALKDHSNFCLDVENGGTHWGVRLQLWNCADPRDFFNSEFSFPARPLVAAIPTVNCSGAKFRSPEGESCIEDCPPGWIKDDSGGTNAMAPPHPWQELFSDAYQIPYYWNPETKESSWEMPKQQVCSLCQGSARRRHTQYQGNMINATMTEGSDACTRCPAGEIPQIDADECQSIQDTCDKKDCEACATCMETSEKDLAQCVLEQESDVECVNPGSMWCSAAIANLAECQSFSLGCYYRIQCHHPCICPEWKSIHCGGNTGGGTCNYKKLASGLLERRHNGSIVPSAMLQRAGHNLERDRQAEHSDLDESLAGKCLS